MQKGITCKHGFPINAGCYTVKGITENKYYHPSVPVCSSEKLTERFFPLTGEPFKEIIAQILTGGAIMARLKEIEQILKHHDICGYCGQPGADKMALWTGDGKYWPGEFVPDTELVHQSCEQAETNRAFNCLTQAERDSFLRGCC